MDVRRGAEDDDQFEVDSGGYEVDDEEISGQVGDYEIIKMIGAGGMGKVYLAEHTRMKRSVAFKVLPMDRIDDDLATERFYDEIRAASRLMHPNIVTAFDAGEADGLNYLAMEYVDGLTLTQIVARGGPLSIGEAVAVIRQAAMGLLHAHRAGIVHRDVKPGNLMRAKDGTIKLLDLGLAQIANSSEAPLGVAGVTDNIADSTGRFVGTLPFVSPEQLENADKADSRSDIYSLGATLYFLLTAKTPYTGELIDQVYGHRHGPIPDLMRVREDADLNFANIFRRMMAKSPAERYASLDEVIDELADYADKSSAPKWLSEFASNETDEFDSTSTGESTSTASAGAIGIDLGMFYAASAEASADGGFRQCMPGGQTQSLLRLAIANDGQQLQYGRDAMALRPDRPDQVAHCLAMYIGREFVERRICEQPNPPEVLLAMLIKHLVTNSWQSKGSPAAVAITVPAVYDQLHRRSIAQAARLAGLKSVRLVDRSLAATQSLLLGQFEDIGEHEISLSKDDHAHNILFVGLTGLGCEVAVIKRESGRLQQVSTAGHWHHGALSWQTRLVELAAEQFQETFGVDPRKSLRSAAQLQIACERAMNSMLLLPHVNVSINLKGKLSSVSVHRRQWLERCEPLIERMKGYIAAACSRAEIEESQFDTCVLLGPMLKSLTIRTALFGGFADDIQIEHVDRADTARGAASIVAAELPGRYKLALPPFSVTGQEIGIVVEDARGRRRILPIIPRGTSLPARTNRRLTVGASRKTMTLSLVESSGAGSDEWQSLGRYVFEIPDDETEVRHRTRMISFQVDTNGLLSVRSQTPGSTGSEKLAPLPEPTMDTDAELEWKDWLKKQV